MVEYVQFKKKISACKLLAVAALVVETKLFIEILHKNSIGMIKYKMKFYEKFEIYVMQSMLNNFLVTDGRLPV